MIERFYATNGWTRKQWLRYLFKLSKDTDEINQMVKSSIIVSIIIDIFASWMFILKEGDYEQKCPRKLASSIAKERLFQWKIKICWNHEILLRWHGK